MFHSQRDGDKLLCSQKGGELIVMFTERWRVNCYVHREMESKLLRSQRDGELIVMSTERWRFNCYVHREMES